MVTKSEIIELLKNNDKAVAHALVVLNERQTDREKNAESTMESNGVGFNSADAHMGTSMAKFYQRNGYLSARQLAYWRQADRRGTLRICKYAGQLAEIAEAKARAATLMESAPAKVNPYVGSDVGNMAEERMVLEEQLTAYQEGAFGEGLEQDRARAELVDRINMINAAIDIAFKNQFGQIETLQEQQVFVDKMSNQSV